MNRIHNSNFKKTKIIATLGPATSSLEMIKTLLNAGVDVFRLNLSHGSHGEHAQMIQFIQQAASELKNKPAILADLQGPKIRTGKTLNDEPVILKAGSRVVVTPESTICTDEIISIRYPNLLKDLKTGDIFLISDGAIQLKVLEINDSEKRLIARVMNTGIYRSHKGVNFPEVQLSVPALTEKDLRDLSFILTQDIHFIALSFVRRPEDLEQLKEKLGDASHAIRIIAKIEKPEATTYIDEILNHCDGIMVARGDLGVEMSLAKVPTLQKDLIAKANRAGKTVIVATQMLESMIENPRPTRAEATDVANAILDGTDAVMLSGETAIGQFPAEAVEMMKQIIRATEASRHFKVKPFDLSLSGRKVSHALCEAAVWASRDLQGIPILVFTISGETAWYISKNRSNASILAFSPEPLVVAQLALAWNTLAFQIPFEGNLIKLITLVEEKLLNEGVLKQGTQVIIVSGTIPLKGATNFIRVKRVGEG